MLSITANGGTTNFVFGMQWADLIARSAGDFTRDKTLFTVSTRSGSLVMTGTYDELCDFASDIAVRLMSWPLANGKTDWFDSEELDIIERTGNDGAQDADGR